MGHAHMKNLDELMIKQIYAHGKVSIAQMSSHAQKKKEGLRASEKCYNDPEDYELYGMVRIGIEWCIRWHMEGWHDKCRHEPDALIEPILETDEEKRVFNLWNEGDQEEDESSLEVLHSIKWKFGEGGRKAYLEKKIDWLTNYTN